MLILDCNTTANAFAEIASANTGLQITNTNATLLARVRPRTESLNFDVELNELVVRASGILLCSHCKLITKFGENLTQFKLQVVE